MSEKTFYPYLKFDPAYAYASARVRALEARFLDAAKIRKLVISKDVKHFIGEMSDSPYKKYIDKLEKHLEFEDMLFSVFKDVIEELSELSLNKDLRDYFNLYFDVYNIKMIFKSDRFRLSAEEKLYDYGNIGRAALNPDGSLDISKVPKRFLGLFEQLRAAGEKQRTELIVNEIVDEFYFSEIARYAKLLKSDFLLNLNMHTIELTNAQTLLRHKLYNFPHVRFISGGFTCLSTLERMKEHPFSEIVKYFSQKGYSELFEKSQDDAKVMRDFIRNIRTFTHDLIWETQYLPMGIEILIVYFYRKRDELRTLRKIFFAKLRNIGKDELVGIIYD